MNLTITSTLSPYDKPDNAVFPLSLGFLRQHLYDLLPNANVTVSFEWYPNTSDVLIAGQSSYSVSEWSIRLIAVNELVSVDVREHLLNIGLARLRNWFYDSDLWMQANPSLWLNHSLTFRYENDSLIFDESEAEEPTPRADSE